MAADNTENDVERLPYGHQLQFEDGPLDGDGCSSSSSEEVGEMELPEGREARDPAVVSGPGESSLSWSELLDDDTDSFSSWTRTFELQTSSAVLSLSPPHSPRLPADTLDPFDRLSSQPEPVSLAGEFVLPEPEAQARASADVPIDYIPLPMLKDRLITHDNAGVQSMEHSLAVNCTLSSTSEKLEAAWDALFNAEFVQDTPVQRPEGLQSQPMRDWLRYRRHALASRAYMKHPTTPQKLHIQRKRAKFFPHLSKHPASAGGSSSGHGASSSRQSLQFEGGWAKQGLSLGPPSDPSSSQLAESNMETDNDGDDNNEKNSDDQKDDEPRFDLTDDLLLKVFSFLDHSTLCQSAMVCRQWHGASVHEDFWKSLNFENRQVTSAQVAELCNRYPRATELHMKNAINVDEGRVRDVMRSLRHLEKLTLGRNPYSEMLFYTLSECSSLRTLSITDSVLGSGGASEVVLRHEGLRSLQMLKCRVVRITIRCPQLEELSLKRTSTASAILQCPRLTSLDVSHCHKLSDTGVRTAAIACPLLVHMNISHCVYLTDDTLREISLACTQLQTLDVSSCLNISLQGVRMPMLTELKLQSCEGINSSSMVALSHCLMLEVLAMDSCWLLTSVNLDLPHLRSISLASNKKLMEVTLRCPSLASLELKSCPALNRVDLYSSDLQKLDLRQRTGLSSLALHCPRLQIVDLSECESLTDLVCDVFSERGGCPKLKTLILDNCDGLENVRLHASSLERLSLIGCKKVTTLALSAPGLQQLHLDGCDRLIDATFAPVGLASLNLGICPHLTTLVIKADHMTMLDLRGCGLLSQASIACPNLSSLNASYCSQLDDSCLTSTTAACPAIQHLVLAACFLVGSQGLLALKKLVDLTTLDLSYTFLTDLSPIFEACPRLKVLRLSACKYLEDTALDALHGGKKLPELQELDISYGSLGRRAIEAVLAHCPHLVQISLNGCANVTDHLWANLSSSPIEALTDASTNLNTTELAVQPVVHSSTSERALQSLSCVGCQNVRSVHILAETCPHLSTINFSLSSNIREVHLACLNLVSLNLSNCAALSVLKLDCPRLTTLSLHACAIESQMLEVALQGCTMLETLDVRDCSKITAAGLATIRGLCPNIKRLYSSVPPEYRLLPR